MRAVPGFVIREITTLLFGPDGEKHKKVVLACCLVAIVLFLPFFAGSPPLRDEEALLWEKTRSAQTLLWNERTRMGLPADTGTDPWKTGLIGVEWSPVTTTLGSLEAKRTSTDPRWSLAFLDWYRSVGLEKGDSIAVLASGSFPGFILSALLAAEHMDLEVLLLLSLGASSWGANIPELPVTVILEILRHGGFLQTAPVALTLGGAGELAKDLSPEGRRILMDAAGEAKAPLLTGTSFQELLENKWRILAAASPKAIVQIGGSQANLGTEPSVLELKPGILWPEAGARAGNGMIARSLESGIPVIHILDVRSLARKTGIPYDGKPEKAPPRRIPRSLSLAGVLAWSMFLLGFRRWSLEEGGTFLAG